MTFPSQRMNTPPTGKADGLVGWKVTVKELAPPNAVPRDARRKLPKWWRLRGPGRGGCRRIRSEQPADIRAPIWGGRPVSLNET